MSAPRLLDLPHGFQTVIDEADWPTVRHLTLYRGTNGYVYFSTWRDGKSRPRTLHAFLMGFPTGGHVDHINRDKLDNRRANLRFISFQANQVNRNGANRNNRLGIRGVSFCPQLSLLKPYRAQIMAGRKQRHIGLFATLEEAIAARQAAELRLFGEHCP